MRIQRLLALGIFLSSIVSSGQVSKVGEVAPGIILPTDGDATVLALDAGPSGPALVHIQPHEVILASHATSNALRGLVYAGPHLPAEMDGLHADTTLASPKAVIFVRLSGEEAEIMRSRVHLLWLQPAKKRRQVAEFTMNVFRGQRTRNVNEVPSQSELVAGTNWLRITPKDPLLPGEFAVTFLPKDANQLPTTAFDFGVRGVATSGNPYSPMSVAGPDAKK